MARNSEHTDLFIYMTAHAFIYDKIMLCYWAVNGSGRLKWMKNETQTTVLNHVLNLNDGDGRDTTKINSEYMRDNKQSNRENKVMSRSILRVVYTINTHTYTMIESGQ